VANMLLAGRVLGSKAKVQAEYSYQRRRITGICNSMHTDDALLFVAELKPYGVRDLASLEACSQRIS
jgi:hypothetical protein